MVPVKAFVPESTSVPAPVLVTEPPPALIGALTKRSVAAAPSATLNVNAPTSVAKPIPVELAIVEVVAEARELIVPPLPTGRKRSVPL